MTIIFMSSVEIFDGIKGGYKEDDTPDPLNFYGILKLKVEEKILRGYTNPGRIGATRFGFSNTI